MPNGRGSELWLSSAQVRKVIRRFTSDPIAQARLHAILARCEYEKGRACAYATYFRKQGDSAFASYLRALD
jgi:hypothetical protein